MRECTFTPEINLRSQYLIASTTGNKTHRKLLHERSHDRCSRNYQGEVKKEDKNTPKVSENNQKRKNKLSTIRRHSRYNKISNESVEKSIQRMREANYERDVLRMMDESKHKIAIIRQLVIFMNCFNIFLEKLSRKRAEQVLSESRSNISSIADKSFKSSEMSGISKNQVFASQSKKSDKKEPIITPKINSTQKPEVKENIPSYKRNELKVKIINEVDFNNLSKSSEGPEMPVEVSPNVKQVKTTFRNLENHLNEFCKNKSLENTPPNESLQITPEKHVLKDNFIYMFKDKPHEELKSSEKIPLGLENENENENQETQSPYRSPNFNQLSSPEK